MCERAKIIVRKLIDLGVFEGFYNEEEFVCMLPEDFKEWAEKNAWDITLKAAELEKKGLPFIEAVFLTIAEKWLIKKLGRAETCMLCVAADLIKDLYRNGKVVR